MTDTLQTAYDVRDGTYRLPGSEAVRQWAIEQGIDVFVTYRIEIHLLDCPFARVFQYDRNEDGRPYCAVDHDHMEQGQHCESARRKPYDVVISSMPPAGHHETGDTP